MRWLMAVGVAVACLLGAAVAMAGERAPSTGTGAGGLHIRFALNWVEDEPTKLTRFHFRNLRASCAGGVTARAEGRIRRIRVNDRNRFRKDTRRNGMLIRVRGAVAEDLDSVTGRIRVEGRIDGARRCDSEWVRWRAR